MNLLLATLKKAEQIAQQNTFSLFTLEDRLITCDLARQWLHLRRTQELAKLKAEVAAEAAASSVAAPPLVGVCSSPGNKTPSCEQQTPPMSASISCPPAPAPAPTQTQDQGIRFRDLNHVADDVDDDDCAELDDEDDAFLDRGYEAVSLTDRRRVYDREEDNTIIMDSEASEFQINPPPSQRRRLSIDPHDMHAAHVQFWNSGIREDYDNRHMFSQPAQNPSPHNSHTVQSWLQGARA